MLRGTPPGGVGVCSGGGAPCAWNLLAAVRVGSRGVCLVLFGCVVFVVERGRCVERGRLSADPCGVGVGTVHVPPSTAQ